ncbi:hypothetical protein EVAR_62806_1 [Eumeta japonica]|uniref:Uncharacterized protein n=1 Tax=Eumeta variegata TaxID=151549 RepID=A0A4C1ZLC5_EUMVA|nr:hypothetical protein EVAR_62806_1 [Eumeta japonica]
MEVVWRVPSSRAPASQTLASGGLVTFFVFHPRASEPPQRTCRAPERDKETCTHPIVKGVIGALSASWVGVGIYWRGEPTDGGGSGVMDAKS